MRMQSEDLLTMSREELEQLAMQKVCACDYYDLADTISETPDADLIKVICSENTCGTCATTA